MTPERKWREEKKKWNETWTERRFRKRIVIPAHLCARASLKTSIPLTLMVFLGTSAEIWGTVTRGEPDEKAEGQTAGWPGFFVSRQERSNVLSDCMEQDTTSPIPLDGISLVSIQTTLSFLRLHIRIPLISEDLYVLEQDAFDYPCIHFRLFLSIYFSFLQIIFYEVQYNYIF